MHGNVSNSIEQPESGQQQDRPLNTDPTVIEAKVMKDYAHYLGKDVLVKRICGYVGDDSTDIELSPPAKVRVETTNEQSLKRWIDGWCDPLYEVALVEEHPQLNGVRLLWIHGPSLHLNGKQTEASDIVEIAEPQSGNLQGNVSICTEQSSLPAIESSVTVRLIEGVVVSAVVTGHGQKAGKPSFDFDYEHRTRDGQMIKASKWAWPEQVQPEVHGNVSNYVDQTPVVLTVTQAEFEIVRVAVQEYRELIASPTSADRDARGDDWADREVAASDALLNGKLAVAARGHQTSREVHGTVQRLYHGTSSSNIPGILSGGLNGPSCWGSKEVASYFAGRECADVGGHPTLISIAADELDQSAFAVDTQMLDFPVLTDIAGADHGMLQLEWEQSEMTWRDCLAVYESVVYAKSVTVTESMLTVLNTIEPSPSHARGHTAYEVTVEDVESVLRSNSLAVANTNGKSFESMANELHGDLDFDLIERAALAGDDLDEQTDYANDEIARQLREMGVLEPLKQAYDSPSLGM